MIKIYLKLDRHNKIKRTFFYRNINEHELDNYIDNKKFKYQIIDKDLVISTEDVSIYNILKRSHFICYTNDLSIVDKQINKVNNIINCTNKRKKFIEECVKLNLYKINPIANETDAKEISRLILVNLYYLKNNSYLDTSLYFSNNNLVYSCVQYEDTTIKIVPIHKYMDIIYYFISLNLDENIYIYSKEQIPYINKQIKKIIG